MPHHDSFPQTIGETTVQIVGLIIIHQCAGVDAHTALFLDNHFRERTHECLTSFLCVIGRHAAFGNRRHFGVTTRRQEVRERDDRRILRQLVSAKKLAVLGSDGVIVFARIGLSRNGDFEAALVQLAQALPGFRKTSTATAGVVSRLVGIVDADAERDWIRLPGERLDLSQPLQYGVGAVG